ncbi:hypothetical protein J6590_011849 [Homalodisca vitripennis]|nr:hypothetical protein J6590_011849 [Homalodisca vitripennis]
MAEDGEVTFWKIAHKVFIIMQFVRSRGKVIGWGTLVMDGGGAGLPTEETRGQASVAIRTQSNLDL